MRVVIAHGRGAAMDIPELMERELFAALHWSLERVRSSFASPRSMPELRLSFFGDFWRPDEFDSSPMLVWPSFVPVIPILEGLVAEAAGAPESILAATPVPISRSWESTIAFWSDWILGTGDDVLRFMLSDLDDYFHLEWVRDDVNQRVAAVCTDGLKKGEQVVLIGFSMGAFVAYDMLRDDMVNRGGRLPVKALITCGAPLAMPSLYNWVQTNAPGQTRLTPFPTQLDIWANIWNGHDPGTAGHGRFAQLFPAPPNDPRSVQEFETQGRGSSPTDPGQAHNANDYLSSIALGSVLDQILNRLS